MWSNRRFHHGKLQAAAFDAAQVAAQFQQLRSAIAPGRQRRLAPAQRLQLAAGPLQVAAQAGRQFGGQGFGVVLRAGGFHAHRQRHQQRLRHAQQQQQRAPQQRTAPASRPRQAGWRGEDGGLFGWRQGGHGRGGSVDDGPRVLAAARPPPVRSFAHGCGRVGAATLRFLQSARRPRRHRDVEPRIEP
jgi:hypothetical protein